MRVGDRQIEGRGSNIQGTVVEILIPVFVASNYTIVTRYDIKKRYKETYKNQYTVLYTLYRDTVVQLSTPGEIQDYKTNPVIKF